MATPIALTNELITTFAKEFIEELRKGKFPGGKISYTRSMTYKDDYKAVIRFTPTAYLKMISLVFGYDSEVAWHGVAIRDEKTPNLFHITDILVYPQEVGAATVDMDEEGYAKWLLDNADDDRFFDLRMQGHSHVNMGVTPSGTDDAHKQEILKICPKDGFYIFMIWNKKLDRTVEIFDVRENIHYEGKDITLEIADDTTDIVAFMEDAKKMTPKKTYASKNSVTVVTTGAAAPAQKQSAANTKKPTVYPGSFGYDDYDDMYGYYGDYYRKYQ